jgi:catechol-2,3-dioxygenase
MAMERIYAPSRADETRKGTSMEMKLEVVPLPVRDVDAAKDFYTKQVGFQEYKRG